MAKRSTKVKKTEFEVLNDGVRRIVFNSLDRDYVGYLYGELHTVGGRQDVEDALDEAIHNELKRAA